MGERNLTLLTDYYEFTMSNGYFLLGRKDQRAAFDVFYRENPSKAGFSIFGGLEQIINFLLDMHFTDADIEYLRSFNAFDEKFLSYLRDFKFTGDVYAFPEGTVMSPNEPIITIVAPIIEAQLVETFILNQFNHQSNIVTKTNRIVRAAKGRPVVEFGCRRAQNADAAIYGARAAMLGGAVGTSTVLAGQIFGMPVAGTHAHSWIMSFPSEEEAFRAYAELYPENCTFLIDTYDVLRSGAPNAIKVAKEYLEPNGNKLKSVRLDSGDLSWLSKEVRKMLDDAGLTDTKIMATNALDEWKITEMLDRGAQIDSFGVGDNLITASPTPTFGGVYKLAAMEEDGVWVPKIKISATQEKITNPGFKKVYRVYNEQGFAHADLITCDDETPDLTSDYKAIAPKEPWRRIEYHNCTIKELRRQYIKGGKLIETMPSIPDIAAYVKKQMVEEIWDEEKRFSNPHEHYVDFSPKYYKMKLELMERFNEED